MLALALFAAASEPWEGTEAGDRTYRPGTAAAVQDAYRGDVPT